MFKKGFIEHIISSICEWTFAILLMILLSSFTNYFRQLKVHTPKIDLLNDDTLLSDYNLLLDV